MNYLLCFITLTCQNLSSPRIHWQNDFFDPKAPLGNGAKSSAGLPMTRGESQAVLSPYDKGRVIDSPIENFPTCLYYSTSLATVYQGSLKKILVLFLSSLNCFKNWFIFKLVYKLFDFTVALLSKMCFAVFLFNCKNLTGYEMLFQCCFDHIIFNFWIILICVCVCMYMGVLGPWCMC